MKSNLILIFALTFITLNACKKKPSQDILNISSQIPSDININLKNKLVAEGKIPQAQQLHDVFSWESFIALNWPTSESGELKSKLEDSGNPQWYQWKETYEVFQDSAKTPEPWSSTVRDIPNFLKGASDKTSKSKRLLHRTSKLGKADEIFQAFAGPLYDQNGNLIRYEVLMNKEEFDYIVNNKLYSVNGQVAFSKNNENTANFPGGVYGDDKQVGATEIKIAWKVLVKGKDDFSRYLVAKADLLNLDGTYTNDVTVGMVGMHINHKTKSAKQWVWSTFEHVDNITVNALESFVHAGVEIPMRPTLSNPNCEYCPVNQYGKSTQIAYNGDTINLPYYIDESMKIPNNNAYYKNQVNRVIPIAKQTENLNREAQRILAEKKSPLQYYELVGTQWPKDPNQPPASPTYSDLPQSVINKPGGNPQPIFLTNMTMETYFQNANQSASSFMENGSQPVSSKNEKLLFGTESCMGCHSSAGMAKTLPTNLGEARSYKNYGGQLSADFVWLLKTQAHYIDNDTLSSK